MLASGRRATVRIRWPTSAGDGPTVWHPRYGTCGSPSVPAARHAPSVSRSCAPDGRARCASPSRCRAPPAGGCACRSRPAPPAPAARAPGAAPGSPADHVRRLLNRRERGVRPRGQATAHRQTGNPVVDELDDHRAWGGAPVKEQQLVDRVAGPLGERGLHEQVLAAGIFNPRGHSGAMFAGGLAVRPAKRREPKRRKRRLQVNSVGAGTAYVLSSPGCSAWLDVAMPSLSGLRVRGARRRRPSPWRCTTRITRATTARRA